MTCNQQLNISAFAANTSLSLQLHLMLLQQYDSLPRIIIKIILLIEHLLPSHGCEGALLCGASFEYTNAMPEKVVEMVFNIVIVTHNHLPQHRK
jgi:hypothetical protein